MSSSRLDQLSSAEIERLLKIMGASQGFLLHDLYGAKGIILTFFQMLQRFFDGQSTEEDFYRLRDYLFYAQSKAHDLFSGIENHLGGRKVQWGLTSYMPYIAETVTSSLKELGVTTLPSLGPRVHVIFPQSALYSIVMELARNVVTHSPGSQVALEWCIQPGGFIISVHDSGVAINHLLTDRFFALEIARPELLKVGGGLSMVSRIVHYSDGLFLVRRSALLGGAEFSVHLPVSAHFEEIHK